MAHGQKPDFVFRQNGRVHLNQQGASVQSTTGSRGVRISGSNAGHTMFRGSVKGTGYPLHSPVSPSLPLPCVTVSHHISTGLYKPCTSLVVQVMLLMEQVLRLRCGFPCVSTETSYRPSEHSDAIWSSVKCGEFFDWLLQDC